jgi:hypothetical protein
MEKVSGIGGIFLRAKDPRALRLWYQQHLGVTVTPTTYELAERKPMGLSQEERHAVALEFLDGVLAENRQQIAVGEHCPCCSRREGTEA